MQTNKARSEAALLVLVVFLLGVVLGGLGTHLWGARVFGMKPQPSPRAQYIADMTHAVDLTPDEQKQMNEILDETKAKWTALYVPLNVQKEQIRAEGHARMRAVLSADQQPKFDAYMQHLSEVRKQQAAAQTAANKQ
jgi:hypothetical protein